MSRWSTAFLTVCAAAAGIGCASTPTTVHQALNQATTRVVAERAEERRQCYLASNTARAGKPSRADVSWELSMLGNPVHVEVVSSPRDGELEACYTRVIEKMQFPGGFPHSVVSLSIVEQPDPNTVDQPLPTLPPPPLAHSTP